MGAGGKDDSALYRLAYVSHIAPSSRDTLDVTLRHILIRSHIQNSRDDITGFLITYRGWFAQALEGPRAAVEACYARISRDPRHVSPQIKSRGLVGQRLFPQWSMCGLTLSTRDAEVLMATEQAFNLNLNAASPQAVMRFLEAVSSRYNDQVERLYRNLRLV